MGVPDVSPIFASSTSLLALLGQQPRVEAPSDFEFRVRAGIARAKAEESALLASRSGCADLETGSSPAHSPGFRRPPPRQRLPPAVTFTATYFGQADHATSPVELNRPSRGGTAGQWHCLRRCSHGKSGWISGGVPRIRRPSAVVPTEVASRSDRGTGTARSRSPS
jgi:hypothetical protein